MGDAATARKPHTIRAAVENIRATRGSARQFWHTFDRSPVPMVTVDSQRRNQAANAAARLVFRLSLEDWQRTRIEDLTPPHMVRTLSAQRRRLVHRGLAAGRYDCSLPDGQVTVVYCALANMLPGEHLIVFLPASLPDDELTSLIDDQASPHGGPLTRREREVLTLIASGADSHQIADELAISFATARTHTRNLLQKLGARNRAHAIALAIERNLIDVPPRH